MSPSPSDQPLRPGDPVLVVGGTGLLGRALAPALLDAGLKPVVVSRHAPAPGLLPDEALHLAADRASLPHLLADGAIALPGGRLAVVEVLAEGPEEVAPLLAVTAPLGARFAAIGSAAVFGGAESGRRYTEADRPAPASDAMADKLALEALLARAHASGRGATALRCAYPYGIGHGPLTPLGRDRGIFAALEAGEPIVWAEPGSLAPLQPLWAGDMARAITALLLREERPGPLYHIAGPRVLDWERYLAVLARGRPLGPRIRRLPVAELLALDPDAWWLEDHLRDAPLLDDALLRREVYAPETRLADVVEAWARWCRSDAP